MNCKKIYFILITFVFILFSVFMFSKTGYAIIDFSRESYIPYQMLSGQKLIKDIFLIYGFWGYFVNFLLYKIYPNFNFLVVEAISIGYICSLLFFVILKKYVRYNTAFIFTLFFISINVFANSVFSYVFPYSFSTLWGVLSVFIIIYSILYKKPRLKYIALGLCFISKIEFFALCAILIAVDCFYKKEFKLKNVLYSLIFPSILIFYIIFSKISIGDILNNLSCIHKMMNTDSLNFFYTSVGTFFDINYFKFNLINIFIYFVISLISYVAFKYSKILSCAILFFGFYVVHFPIVYNIAFFIALILSAINFKRLRYKDFILLSFGFILCSKAIFAINTNSYSNFGMAAILFYIYYQFSKFIDKRWLFIHLIIVLILFNFYTTKNIIRQSKQQINTSSGVFYLPQYQYNLFSEINSYLNENLKKEDNFIVLPEGQIFNLIHKKQWGFFNSTFTPLDFETFGEDNLKEKLKELNPKYIVFYPRDTMEYGARTICEDYAIDFCRYIMDNYSVKLIFKDEDKAAILKKNEN